MLLSCFLSKKKTLRIGGVFDAWDIGKSEPVCLDVSFPSRSGTFPQVLALENVEQYVVGDFRDQFLKLSPSWPC